MIVNQDSYKSTHSIIRRIHQKTLTLHALTSIVVPSLHLVSRYSTDALETIHNLTKRLVKVQNVPGRPAIRSKNVLKCRPVGDLPSLDRVNRYPTNRLKTIRHSMGILLNYILFRGIPPSDSVIS